MATSIPCYGLTPWRTCAPPAFAFKRETWLFEHDEWHDTIEKRFAALQTNVMDGNHKQVDVLDGYVLQSNNGMQRLEKEMEKRPLRRHACL